MKIETLPFPDTAPAPTSPEFGVGLLAFLLGELLRLFGVVFVSRAEREACRARAFRVRAAVRDMDERAYWAARQDDVIAAWSGAGTESWCSRMGALWIWTPRRAWTAENRRGHEAVLPDLRRAPVKPWAGLIPEGLPHAPP